MVKIIWHELDAMDPIFNEGPTRSTPPYRPKSKPTSPDASDESTEADKREGQNPPTIDATTKG